MNIGDRIKQARKEKAMTQQELADKINVSRSAVSNWEIGRNYPDVQLIVQISDYLDISLDQLLKGDEQVIKKLSEDTKTRKKQSKKIKILYLIIVLISLTGFYFGYFKFENRTLSSESQIESVELMGNELKIKTNIPSYRSISGYIIESSENDWDLNLSISTQVDFSLKNDKELTITLEDEEIKDKVGINIVTSKNKIIQKIPFTVNLEE